MALQNLISKEKDGEAKIMNIHNEYPIQVQLQISQDGQDAYIDLDPNELKILANKLNEIINS